MTIPGFTDDIDYNAADDALKSWDYGLTSIRADLLAGKRVTFMGQVIEPEMKTTSTGDEPKTGRGE